MTTTPENTNGASNRAARRDSPQSSLRLGLLIFGTYACVVILLLTGTWLLIRQDRAREHLRQEAELASLGRALEEHVLRSFGQVDNTLQSLVNVISEGAHGGGELDDATLSRLREHATAGALRTPQAATLSAWTREGQSLIVVPQRGLPYGVLPPPVAIKRWLTDPNAAMHIALPVKLGNPVNQGWYIPVERGVGTPTGELLGIVSALINTEYFEAFYRDIRLTPQDSIALLTAGGRVLFHYPQQDEKMGTVFVKMPIANRPSDASLEPVFADIADANNAPSIAVFRHLADYPLIIAVTRPQAIAMTDFREARDRLLIGVIALVALLAGIAWISFYEARRRELARIELGRMNTALEARVGRRTAELEQSNRELIAFSYSISHDLRAPLRAINGFAHAVREDYADKLDEQGREYLDRIYLASVRMGELIDELLSLANVSRQPLTIQRVDLSVISQEIIDELKLAEPGRAVQFEVQQGMRTEGDEALLRNALSNLLHNAWKFTRSRRPAVITVTATDEAEHERYVIADNGVGFDMSHAKRLFQPFQQLHTNQGFAGTGIGLASVRRIIERHGGRIWAESMPDHGARFIIELPHRAAVMRRRRGAKVQGSADMTQMDAHTRMG